MFFNDRVNSDLAMMSHKVANLLQSIVIFSILAYIFINDVIINTGYLASEYSTLSTTIAKAKATGITSSPTTNRLYDSTDIVVPSLESNAIFITTSVEVTPNQTQGICTPRHAPACNATNVIITCPVGAFDEYNGGQYTGICNISASRCQEFAWCPAETNSVSDRHIISNMGRASLFLNAQLLFPQFNAIVNNVMDVEHDGAPIAGYNLFFLNEIIGNATNGTITNVTYDIALYGAMILMTIEMDCDLDSALTCIPKFKYYRIDSQPGTITYGENFRTASYYNSYQNRDLIRRAGVRIIFYTFGTATKVSIKALLVTFGFGVFNLIMCIVVTGAILKWSHGCSKTKIEQLLEGDVDLTIN
eukprot:135122_1